MKCSKMVNKLHNLKLIKILLKLIKIKLLLSDPKTAVNMLLIILISN